jgi:hypothetical protein
MDEVKPARVQLRRIKGWKMPANTVKVARPSKWGNPFVIQFDPHGDYSPQTAEGAVEMYRAHVDKGLMRIKIKNELRGKNLACFCPLHKPCHADVLLEIANS